MYTKEQILDPDSKINIEIDKALKEYLTDMDCAVVERIKKDAEVDSYRARRKYWYSTKWLKLKELVIEKRAKNRCENCGKSVFLYLHHHARNTYFQEKASDVAALCYSCHHDHVHPNWKRSEKNSRMIKKSAIKKGSKTMTKTKPMLRGISPVIRSAYKNNVTFVEYVHKHNMNIIYAKYSSRFPEYIHGNISTYPEQIKVGFRILMTFFYEEFSKSATSSQLDELANLPKGVRGGSYLWDQLKAEFRRNKIVLPLDKYPDGFGLLRVKTNNGYYIFPNEEAFKQMNSLHNMSSYSLLLLRTDDSILPIMQDADEVRASEVFANVRPEDVPAYLFAAHEVVKKEMIEKEVKSWPPSMRRAFIKKYASS